VIIKKSKSNISIKLSEYYYYYTSNWNLKCYLNLVFQFTKFITFTSITNSNTNSNTHSDSKSNANSYTNLG